MLVGSGVTVAGVVSADSSKNAAPAQRGAVVDGKLVAAAEAVLDGKGAGGRGGDGVGAVPCRDRDGVHAGNAVGDTGGG